MPDDEKLDEELPIEAVDDWVLTYLKFRINNEKFSQTAIMVEGMLFYARDYLLDAGIKEKNPELINYAKTINSLVNILRKEPAVNYWNSCLRSRNLPINEPVL